LRNYKLYIIPLFVLSLAFLYSEKNDGLRNILLTPEFNFKDTSVHNRYGDLYRLCKVDNFREGMYYAEKPEPKLSPDSADIFIIGDSYFERPVDGEFLSSDLEKLFNFKIYDLSVLNGRAADFPVEAIKNLNYNKEKNKILLLETTERLSYSRALNSYPGSRGGAFPDYDGIKDLLYRTFLYRQFLVEHSRIALPVVQFKNTLNFNLFRVMDRNIGAYSMEPPMLFYVQDVEFANHTEMPGDADKTAEKIEELNTLLKQNYNITLLYIVIPDKYSIYNDYVTGGYKYSGFIPGLVKRLNEKNIYTIDLYTLFMKHKQQSPGELLYYKSDSHFNRTGKNIFLEEVGKKIREMKLKIGG